MADTTDLRLPSERLRELSKRAFGNSSQLEVALAVQAVDPTFTFDELYERVTERSEQAELPPPSRTAVRKDVERMRDTYGALMRLPAMPGEQLRRESRAPSPFWELCVHLALQLEEPPARAQVWGT